MDKACKKNNYSKPAILYLENGQKFYGDLIKVHPLSRSIEFAVFIKKRSTLCD